MTAGIAIGVFYFLQPKKTISPISQKSLENEIIIAEKEPSKTLKEYSDDAGFSFQYPQDVQINKKDITNDQTAYARVEMVGQTKGGISIKVLDTKLKTVDDWFLKNNYTSGKEIKIGELSGKEANVNSKIIAAALDRSVLFIVEVDAQNQKYWQNVYGVILSTFNFVTEEQNNALETQASDGVLDDVVLEEEIVE